MTPTDPSRRRPGMQIDIETPQAAPSMPPMGNLRATGGRPPMAAAPSAQPPMPSMEPDGDEGTFQCPGCGESFKIVPMGPSAPTLTGEISSPEPPPPNGI